MKFFALLSLATAALAAPTKHASPLAVTLELVGNSGVKATVTNTGENSLKLLKTGSILSEAPVEKAKVLKEAQEVGFEGVRIIVAYNNLEEDAFIRIPKGESVDATFDVAELHNLAAGGKYEIAVSGAFQYAEEDLTTIAGFIPFEAELLEAEIDGEMAASVHSSFLQKRTQVQSDCTGDRLSAIQSAVSGCASLASAGQSAAESGDAAKMEEFYKASDDSTRSTVAGVFSRAVSECGSTSGGASATYCTDVYGNTCTGGVVAYTVPWESYMAYCDSFFTFPATSPECYGPSQAFVFLHEATHLTEVGGTDDFGGYGYDFVRSLPAEQNIRHADTYSTFAQAVSVGC